MSLKELIIKRSSVKGRVTKFKNYISKINTLSMLDSLQLGELKLKLGKFECLASEFSDIQGQIETLSGDELDDELDIREEIENEIDSITSLAQDILSRNSSKVPCFDDAQSDSHSHQGQGNSHAVRFKLPLIQIAKFDGTVFRWLEFRDTFRSLIHDNEHILPIYKFHYLSSYLEGDAARVISNLEVCALNYHKAWSLLCERYDNKRQLINNHLNALFNIEVLSRESEQSLRALVDNVNKNLRALASLGQPTDQWDTIIVHMISSKLDSQTSMKWEEYRNSLSDTPTLDQFHKFLKDRADVLESYNQNKIQNKRVSSSAAPIASGSNKNNKFSKQNKSFSYAAPSGVNNTDKRRARCVVCKGDHWIYTCPMFLAKTPELRMAEAQKLRLCMNCLRQNHRTRQCFGGRCRECNKLHNTLLHQADPDDPTARASDSSTSIQVPVENLSVNLSRQSVLHVMLSTVMIEVQNPLNNKTEVIRALLDSGSQSSFLTKRIKETLGLEAIPTSLTVVGIGNNSNNHVTERCLVSLKSLHSEFYANLSCFIMPELTGNIPKSHIDYKHFSLPENIQLADPKFYIPGPVDALIGADLFWDVVGNTIKSLGEGKPYLCSSQFGWVISGPIILNYVSKQTHCNFVSSASRDDHLDNQIAKFWELEELPQRSLLSDSETACEQHFKTHTTRLESGRFCVRLPLKDSPTTLGDSFRQAKKRFFNLEKKFRKQPELKQAYTAFIKEYLDLGHCSELLNFTSKSGYFLCHHAVFRIKSESTKLRVVFDGTAPSSNGISINSLQLIGPTIQDSLFSITLRFRLHKYVLTGDIEKMYRQIEINEKDRNLQLILWREDESQPLRALQLNTVTYGFASASFLSTRCLYQLGEECADDLIKTIIQRDFYYDDLLTGADSEAQLAYILESVQTALKSGCFNLRKFRSNLPSIFEGTKLNLEDNLCLSNSTTALGLGWDPKTDILHFSCQVPSEQVEILTKRQLVSNICKIFDPLGLLSPATIQAKMLIQKLWVNNVEWDQPIPSALLKEWERLQANTIILFAIEIPRYVLCDNHVKVELHSFCDASMGAYGACIYLKAIDAFGRSSVNLLCSKSRVAPVGKPLTIPRLELSAALLAARLCVACLDSLRMLISNCVHWCDSSVVLGWINTSPNKLKMFVANRVAEICEITRSTSWRHVPTNLNPADMISRGVDAVHLKNSELWWNGPEFLLMDENHWPININSKVVEELPELKTHSTTIEPDLLKFENFSSFIKLKRSLAYVLRFTHNCKNSNSKRTGNLMLSELNESFLKLAIFSQRSSFQEEYNNLLKGLPISSKGKLSSLSPFLDEHKVMRVGGRLDSSAYEYEKKHPILLDGAHHLTKLLFRFEHTRLLHAGPQALLYSIRETVWPLGGRALARRTVRDCITCRRHKGMTMTPVMGNLPAQRVMPAFPFQTVGIDFAGPFSILNRKGRGARTTKCYLCLFICFRYKCVHLEAVSDLSKDALILAIRRMISRRGKPSEIFSDNGRNLVAAAKEITQFLKDNPVISDFAADEQIKFSFIPAYAPHFGGLWEAGIKSAKHHIKRYLGNNNFTFEELSTLFTQVEAILNSRPLYPMSSSPDDYLPLSPGHFLIGRPLTALPSPSVEDFNSSSLDRYMRLEQVRQQFWRRWQRDYVSELQQRTKWRTSHEKLRVGDLVLLQEDNVAPLNWRLGRVTMLHPGPDGISRVADIRTARGAVRRALTRICPLFSPDS